MDGLRALKCPFVVVASVFYGFMLLVVVLDGLQKRFKNKPKPF